jgi:hypothetical protein
MQFKAFVYILTGYIAILLSCSKSPSLATAEPVATSKFLVNGTLLEWDGNVVGPSVCLFCGPGIYKDSTYFALTSTESENYAEGLYLRIKTATLNVTTYNDSVTIAVSPRKAVHFMHHMYSTPYIFAASTEVGDFATVTITSVKDGKYYDGTFRARLSSSPFGMAASKVAIEAGEFHNVKVH